MKTEVTVDGVKLTADQVTQAWNALQRSTQKLTVDRSPFAEIPVRVGGWVFPDRVAPRTLGSYVGRGIYLPPIPGGWKIVKDDRGAQVAIQGDL